MPGSDGRILPARRLLAATIITPQGKLIHSGAATPKDVAGYDFHRPLVGALGRLGMLLEVTLAVNSQPAGIQFLRLFHDNPPFLFAQLDKCRTVEKFWISCNPDKELEILIEQHGNSGAIKDDSEQLKIEAKDCELLSDGTDGIWSKVLTESFAQEGYYLRWALPAAQAFVELAKGSWWGSPWECRIWHYLGADQPMGDMPNGQIVFARKDGKLYPCIVPNLEKSDFYIINV